MAEQRTPSESGSSPLHAFAPAVAMLFALILIVAVIALRVTAPDESGVTRGTNATPAESVNTPRVDPLEFPIGPTGDTEFDAGATEVARFVEATRGHPFRDQVRVDLVGDALFTQLLLDDFESGIVDIHTREVTLKALGVLPPDADLVTEVQQSLSAGVIGFYDPNSGQLVIRGTALTPFTRTTLAHELTHALDDQWFDLDPAAMVGAGSDAQFGFQALVEGSASWVEESWSASRSPTERALATTEAREFARNMSVGEVSVAVVQIVESPYTLGLEFVRSITAVNGAIAIDRAFESPPISSEQILHPEKYTARELPLEVAAPRSDGPPVIEETLGELDLTGMLSTSLAPAMARNAGEGWGGDRYVVWTTTSGASCIRLDVVDDTPADSASIGDALRLWVAAQHLEQHQGASVETLAPDTSRLTSCR